MIIRHNRSSSVFAGAASFAALCLVCSGAQAADCFDRNAIDAKAGNATAVTGPEVGLQRADAAEFIRPDAGQDLFTGDRVRTGDASHLQLKLCDWSTYTFSPNSESEISEFYSDDGARRRRVVNFFRGGFRLASGRNTEPGSTEVKIQESGVTMGVRGTSVLLVELDGVVYALLEGPVRDNEALEPRGQVGFWTDENRDAVISSLRRPGWVVTIGPDGVSDPFRAPADLLRRIYEAFVPVIPDEEGEGANYQYAGDPGGDSGQGAQEGGDGLQYAGNDGQRESDDTTNRPEQGCGTTIPIEECEMQAFPINVGDILPLDALEEFAAAQGLMPDGTVLALAQAQLFVDSGSGPVQVDQGVALIQIHVDWASRTIAPEALASFVKLDFSVTNPADLTVRNPAPFNVPPEIEDAYIQAVLASVGVPFASGLGDLAVFNTQLFTFTIRKGVGDTVTVDVDVDVSANDNSGDTFTATSTFRDLMLTPGPGQLAFFNDFDFADVLSIAGLDLVGGSRGGVSTLFNFGHLVVSTLGAPTELTGVAAGQLEINFANRTVGGGSSFLAVTAAADPAIGGVSRVQFIPLNQTVSFDSGLFGLAFYPLAGLTSDPNLLQGQALVNSSDGLFGDIAAILAVDGGNHLYTEFFTPEVFSTIFPIATIADLEAQAAPGALGAGTFHYDGATAVNGFSQIETAGGVFAFGSASASIDINFANRTIGGGNSFVAVDINATFPEIINLNFSELLNAVSFDEAANGAGVFGFDGSDFSGNNIQSLLLLIRDGNQAGAGDFADIDFLFTDGAGGDGFGQVTNMPLTSGATLAPLP